MFSTLSHITRISLQSSLLVMNSSITHKICCTTSIEYMRTLNIKYTYCVTLNNINKLDGYVRPPQIIVLLLQQKDVQLCNDYKSFSQLFWP